MLLFWIQNQFLMMVILTLLVEKSHEYILIYDAAYKTLCSTKLSHTIFDKVVGNIRKYNATKHLA